MTRGYNRSTHIGIVVALLSGAGVCRASNITYQVLQGPIGFDKATISGTLQTDGATGALSASNILAWNIVVADGLGGSVDLTNLNSSLSLTGTATTATSNQLQFNFGTGPTWGQLGDFEILDASNEWGWALAIPGNTALQMVLPLGANGDAGLSALSHQPITLGRVPLEGGTTSAPVFVEGTSVGGVMGTIAGFGAEEYYSFNWAGGPFSASATIAGAASDASYLYTVGVAGSCNTLATQTLSSANTFTSTISVGNLAPGQYCIGLDANNPDDPSFSLTFGAPVGGAPEPSGFVLLSAFFGVAGIRRLAKKRSKILA
jgi:hypothetical protein